MAKAMKRDCRECSCKRLLINDQSRSVRKGSSGVRSGDTCFFPHHSSFWIVVLHGEKKLQIVAFESLNETTTSLRQTTSRRFNFNLMKNENGKLSLFSRFLITDQVIRKWWKMFILGSRITFSLSFASSPSDSSGDTSEGKQKCVRTS